MKEIGGYFELELAKRKEYHQNAIKLNSGTSSFKYILKAQNIKKVYMPNFICNSMIEPLDELSIDYEFYNVNEFFELFHEIKLKENEKLLYVNYFTLKSKYIKLLIEKYLNKIIIDNSQAFFELPIEDIDTIYSPRKFFGVSDGGYLFTKHVLSESFELDESYNYAIQLLGRCDKSASLFFEEYQKAEQRLTGLPIKKMSKLTRKILSSIEYENVKKKRLENFQFLHSKLKNYNLLTIEISRDSIPFTYPFMTNNIALRKKLISNKIYIAKYWNEVLGRIKVSEIEKKFVNNIIPLPIDQRYNLEDMQRIVAIIQKNRR